MALISVIVPCYNEEKSIKNCIDSLLEQTYSDFEIIVINDGSSDKTSELIKTYNDKKIVFLDNKKNKGRRAAINDALKISKGTYVAITDADCEIPRDWLSKICSEFEKDEKLDAVGGVYESLSEDAMSLAGNMLERIFMDFELIPNLLPGANSAYKKSVLVKVGGYPERKWGADSFLTMILKEKGYKIKISPRITVKTQYPNTIKKAIKRKYYWGGGLANIMDKTQFRVGFLIRPAYFSLTLLSIVFTIIFAFLNQTLFYIGLIGTLAILIMPNILLIFMSLYWMIKNGKKNYFKATPYMLFLPFIQELSYFVGFVNVAFGRGLKNAWR